MPVPPTQSERFCQSCGAKLSRYNSDSLCWPCQKERRATPAEAQAATSPLPTLTPSDRSAFTLRSILATARRTKPLRLSDVGQVLKHYRSIHQLPQRDLAALLGFDQSYICRLENGRGLRDIATRADADRRSLLPGQNPWRGGQSPPRKALPLYESTAITQVARKYHYPSLLSHLSSSLLPLFFRTKKPANMTTCHLTGFMEPSTL